MSKDKTIVIRGELYWAKVLGAPRPHTGNPKYDKGPYWSVDVTPNAESRADIEKYGISEKLKEPNTAHAKEDRTETFLSLRVLENKSDGGKNLPPRVVDIRGADWPQNVEIGNKTIGDVKVRIVDYGKGVQKGVYLQAIRILDLVPYEREAFAPLSSDDEYFAAADEETSEDTASTAFDADLDDDVPF